MVRLRGSRSLLGVALVALGAVGACSGATASAVPSESVADPSASTPVPASVSASAGASSAASPGALALPEACITAIRDHLIAIEPIVSAVDWQVATEVPPQIAEQLDSAAFDPDVCPDVSVPEAHAAWAAIATDVAPGALGYVDFIYRP